MKRSLFAFAVAAVLTLLAGCGSAQIILRWQLQDGYVAIPGSSNPDHIAENYDLFDFELTEAEMQRIRDLDLHRRYENW